MTSEKLHDALNLLPADLVAETDALRTQAKKPQVHWQRWAAMAACLAVVLLAGTMFSHFFGHMGSSKTSAAVDKAQMSIAEAAAQKLLRQHLRHRNAGRKRLHAPRQRRYYTDGHSGTSGLYQRRHLQLFRRVHGEDRDRRRIRSEPDGILRPLRRRAGSADPKAGGRHPGDRRATGRIIPLFHRNISPIMFNLRKSRQ